MKEQVQNIEFFHKIEPNDTTKGTTTHVFTHTKDVAFCSSLLLT